MSAVHHKPTTFTGIERHFYLLSDRPAHAVNPGASFVPSAVQLACSGPNGSVRASGEPKPLSGRDETGAFYRDLKGRMDARGRGAA